MKDMMLYHTKHLEENNGYEKRWLYKKWLWENGGYDRVSRENYCYHCKWLWEIIDVIVNDDYQSKWLWENGYEKMGRSQKMVMS
jgi:hypothetical protein